MERRRRERFRAPERAKHASKLKLTGIDRKNRKKEIIYAFLTEQRETGRFQMTVAVRRLIIYPFIHNATDIVQCHKRHSQWLLIIG